MILDYLPIFIFIVIVFILSSIMVAIPALFSIYRSNKSKLDAYECGFDQFNWNKMNFDVRFYLVSILFIIFDLEIFFLFPWASVLGKIDYFGFFSMYFFLFLLTIGFLYEWRKGALEWN